MRPPQSAASFDSASRAAGAGIMNSNSLCRENRALIFCSQDDWREERLLDDGGEEIFLPYKGEPSKERYEFVRDYLDFKLKRMK